MHRSLRTPSSPTSRPSRPSPTSPSRAPMNSRQKLLVIGNGMVGQRLLEYVTGESHDFDITVLCEEPRAAYDRVQLSAFFSGKSAQDLSLVETTFFDANGITLHLNDKAASIEIG